MTTEAPTVTSEASKYPKRVRRSSKSNPNKQNTAQQPPGTKQHGNPSGNRGPKDQEPPTPSPEEIELTERQEKELQENLTTWLAVMAIRDKELTYQLGHQFEDMVLRCTIKSTNCTHPKLSFESSFTPTEGNCFTYTSKTFIRKGLHLKREETSLAGVDHGLELVLNLQVNEYLPGTAQVGALVMVHSPDDFGTSASEAIFIAPEKATYIGLKMVQIKRLPAPYPEKCIDAWPKTLTGSLTQNATYSQQACLKICLQRTIQRRCHCQSAFLAQVEENNADLRICDTRKKFIRKCVEEVMFRPENKIDDCECPPRCQVIQYEKTVSLAKWPTREDRVTFDRGVKSVNLQSVAKVFVYYQTMTLQEVTQQGAWTTAKLFSSLGGFMGMYVGFSFLSLFEVFEVICRRAWYAWRKKKPKFKTIAKTVAFTAERKLKTENNNPAFE
ncbi:Amiloride-sensitive sodium channel-like protein [Leptotrombidium deliense]|uniref:Amiloride-sensitive sodium channel-like protein n=1 Tax=Leptotrombidium deliense TaxID=299467 RepID=A0A443S7J0_9ACAR|nr:Amiloride-sensitive sodium channel-like protein [Leptotrombidium deliense]